MTAAELEAVTVAGLPTSGAVAALRAARSTRRVVLMASNNSAECVQRFLKLHDLREYVEGIVGRPFGQPYPMKPNPFSLTRTAEQANVGVTN